MKSYFEGKIPQDESSSPKQAELLDSNSIHSCEMLSDPNAKLNSKVTRQITPATQIWRGQFEKRQPTNVSIDNSKNTIRFK